MYGCYLLYLWRPFFFHTDPYLTYLSCKLRTNRCW